MAKLELELLSAGKEKSDPARAYAKEAYSAMKDGDETGFIEAFLSAIRSKSKDPAEPDADDEE